MTEIPILTTPAKWFKGMAIAAVIWNLFGTLQYLAHVTITPETLARLSMEEQQLITAMPNWAISAFAIAVFTGLLGSILLLMRKSSALFLFIISMLGLVIQNYYSFFISNALEVYGSLALFIPVLVFVVGIMEIWLCMYARKNGWFS